MAMQDPKTRKTTIKHFYFETIAEPKKQECFQHSLYKGGTCCCEYLLIFINLLFSFSLMFRTLHQKTGLTNLMFCKPNTRIIEIFSPDYVNFLYWYLSNQMQLTYYYFLGAGKQSPDYVDPHEVYKHIFIPIDKLIQTLELTGI